MQCIVCQSHQGVLYCSITYTSKLSQKEKLADIKFKPPMYFIFFPNENVFFTTRAIVPDVISDSLVDLYRASRLKKLPLEGKDFMSLRQLHFNKLHKGKLTRRPVKDSHPLEDFDSNKDGGN